MASLYFCLCEIESEVIWTDGRKDSALPHPTYVGIIHFRSSPVLRKSGRLSNKIF